MTNTNPKRLLPSSKVLIFRVYILLVAMSFLLLATWVHAPSFVIGFLFITAIQISAWAIGLESEFIGNVPDSAPTLEEHETPFKQSHLDDEERITNLEKRASRNNIEVKDVPVRVDSELHRKIMFSPDELLDDELNSTERLMDSIEALHKYVRVNSVRTAVEELVRKLGLKISW